MDAASPMEALQGPLGQWVAAVATASAIMLLGACLKPMLLRRLSALSQRTCTSIDDAAAKLVEATRLSLVFVLALCAGAQQLALSGNPEKFIDGIAVIVVFLQFGLWLAALLDFWVGRSRTRAIGSNAAAATSLAAVSLLGHVLVWALVLLLALDNLGINITALVAGLGIGGVAVALAVQNILGDLFASLSIVVDKPFVIGDFIIVDEYMGTVEYVGLKTTRIRSLGGEQIIFSNSDLLKSRVRNYKRMYERRVQFNFDLVYETSLEKLEQVPGLVRGLIEAQQKVRFERAHFQGFAASSLRFEVAYWVLDADYNLYMDIQQAINLGMMRELQRREIRFAYPVTALRIDQPLQLERVRADAEDRPGPGPARDTARRSYDA